MKKFLTFLALTFFFNCFSQSPIDGYKYAYVANIEYDEGIIDLFGLQQLTVDYLKKIRIINLRSSDIESYYEKKNPCELIYVNINHKQITKYSFLVNIYFTNCLGKVIKVSGEIEMFAKGLYSDESVKPLLRKALNRALSKINSYNYNPILTPKLPKFKLGTSLGFDINSLNTVREYFKKNGVTWIEGIWRSKSGYKLLIIKDPKDDYRFKCIILERDGIWFAGEEKAIIEKTASDEVATVIWKMGNKINEFESIASIKENAIIEFEFDGEKAILYKLFPTLDKSINTTKKTTNEWSGNGSGVIISKSGYIVTNHHVIEGANDIEIEFVENGELQKYNAEVVQSDKINDLAIIKIFDMSFNGLDNLPYNFKSRSSDVGTKVYAYGYPMALTVMGKEIKITDGIISSKSGYDGDITTYQISAPIQSGNSGGPLFDEKGSLIGINSSGLSKDVADNVGYAIKSSYILNLIDVLPVSIDLPSSTKLQSIPLTDQIKEISKYVVLIKVK
ncbi:MAG: S1C family serine protease [Flavobacteriaceae bacterium]